MNRVKQVKAWWMLIGGIAFLIGDLFGAKGSNWYNYIDNIAVYSMIISGASYLKNPKKTALWFDKSLLIPVLFFNISLVAIGFYHPGHTLNAVSGMLLVLAMITHNENIPKWVLKYIYISYLIMILYSISNEDVHFQMLSVDPSKFYFQQYLNYVFFGASMGFLIQVSAAKDKEFHSVKKSFDDLKEYDVQLLNALLHNIKAPAQIIASRFKIASLSNADTINISEIENSVEILNSQLLRIDEFSKMINDTQENSLLEISNKLKKRKFAKFQYEHSGNMDTKVSKNICFVLENFIENAFNFASNTKVSIEERQGKVSITIKDKGLGIEPEVFQKLGGEIIAKKDSFGLGVILSRYIVKKHNWSLELATKYNVGSILVLSNRSETNKIHPEDYDLYRKI